MGKKLAPAVFQFQRIKIISKRVLFLFFLLFTTVFANEEKVREIVEKRWAQSTIDVRRINGGLTNENYLVTIDEVPYFLRYSLLDNHFLGLSLDHEWQISLKAALIELAPKALFYFPEDRVILSEYIFVLKDPINLQLVDVMKEFCQMVARLHHSEIEFPTVFCPFKCIKTYIENALNLRVNLPEIFFEKVLPQLEKIEKLLPDQMKVPCHLDLYNRNVVSDGKRLYLVDWEYAAMADPFFDLATFASAEFFSDEEMNQLLEIYLEKAPSEEERSCFYFMRILADIRWSLWAYLQAKISPINGSFIQMGEDFLKEVLGRIMAKSSLEINRKSLV
jgi:thiamine kinase-like enzyme